MATTVVPLARTRHWTRVEYERLIELGMFQPGERLELLDGLLVVREPHGNRHAAAIRRAVLFGMRHANQILSMTRAGGGSASRTATMASRHW